MHRMTGEVRIKRHNRWFRKPLVIVLVEIILPSGGTTWVNASPNDMMILQPTFTRKLKE